MEVVWTLQIRHVYQELQDPASRLQTQYPGFQKVYDEEIFSLHFIELN